MERAGRAGGGAAWRSRRAARAGLRLRVVPCADPDHDRDRLDPHDVPDRVGAYDGHRSLADRAVPDCADRPRRVDRLLAAGRHALARGARSRAEGDEAVARAMETAGRSVVFSGTTVAIGLLALVALPLPFLRTVGYGGMLIPLVSVIVASRCCPSYSQPRPASGLAARRSDDKASRFWTGWAASSCAAAGSRRSAPRWCWLRSAFAASSLQLGLANLDSLAKKGDAKQGLIALERSGIGSGALLPHEVLVEGASSPGAVAQLARGDQGRMRRRCPAGPRGGARRGRFDAFRVPDGSRLPDATRSTASATAAHRPATACGWVASRHRTTTSSTRSTATSR